MLKCEVMGHPVTCPILRAALILREICNPVPVEQRHRQMSLVQSKAERGIHPGGYGGAVAEGGTVAGALGTGDGGRIEAWESCGANNFYFLYFSGGIDEYAEFGYALLFQAFGAAGVGKGSSAAVLGCGVAGTAAVSGSHCR